MFDDKGGEMYPKSKQIMPLARGRNGKYNTIGCMVIGGVLSQCGGEVQFDDPMD